MIQVARPRSVLCSIPFRLGVQLDKEFSSKWLISHLHKLGFSISPDEVQKYKQSSVVSDGKEITQEIEEVDEIEEAGPSEVNTTGELDVTNDNAFAQWSGDNVDYNSITLIGKGTFHGIGIISMSDDCSSTKTIKRLKYTLKSSEFGKFHGIRIHQYLGFSTKGLAALSFKNARHLSKPLVMPKEVGYKLLWQTPRSLRNDPTLYWLGFMEELLKSETPVQKSTITFSPIIDLNPNDESCIYPTLLFVIEQAKRMRVPVPCVTFDQHLWLKACGIIEEGDLDIVARLGGFHTYELPWCNRKSNERFRNRGTV